MIYCVEDDSSIRELMAYTLTTAGYTVKGFEDSDSFWEAIKNELPELIMLDIMLPGEDGLSILKKLRDNEATSAIPVIMATAKGTEYDRVMGLDTGADDYLCKPFGMMEMISRVKAVLRRSRKNASNDLLTAGDVTMNLADHTVRVSKEEIELTLKEFELLKLFLENKGRVYTREQLLSLVWGTDFAGETRTVDVHIGTLRTKLRHSSKLIKTVRGVGYKMEIRP